MSRRRGEKRAKFINLLAFASAVTVFCVVASGYGSLAYAEPSLDQSHEANEDACSALLRTKLDGAAIVSATSQPANAPVQGTAVMLMPEIPVKEVSGLPAFCRVVGQAQPEPGSTIGFEVWLPMSGWNGRFRGLDNGGFAGYINYMMLGEAVKRGIAVVATDTGHIGAGPLGPMFDSSWAKGQPARIRDYAWRAVHLSTVAAKEIVSSFYGRGPDYSYFVGCSNGGRQALMQASRFPDDYDGLIAGAPAVNWPDLLMGMMNTVQAQITPGSSIRKEQLPYIQEEALRQCDAMDGQEDGLIEDPRQCRIDVARLTCGKSKVAQCLSNAQAKALQRIYTGPRDRSGRQVVSGFAPGAEVGEWDGYVVGTADQPSRSKILASGFLHNVFNLLSITPENFNFDVAPATLRAMDFSDLDPSADLSRFFARGGKLILWHGWADSVIRPQSTLDYHGRMLASSGQLAEENTRLFMVPGVQHCGGGTGPSSLGQLSIPGAEDRPESNMAAALHAWVEDGRHPESLIGTRPSSPAVMSSNQKSSGAIRQRLLCIWPKKAVLEHSDDPERASSYRCIGH